MSWTELNRLVGAGDVESLAAYWATLGDFEPEEIGQARSELYRRALEPVNSPILAFLLAHLPLPGPEELKLARTLVQTDQLPGLRSMSPRAHLFGAVRARSMPELEMALERNPEKMAIVPATDLALRMIPNNYEGLAAIVQHLNDRSEDRKSLLSLLDHILVNVVSSYNAQPGSEDLLVVLLRHGARLPPRPEENSIDTLMYGIMGNMDFAQPEPEFIRLLLALYESGYGEELSPRLQRLVFRDEGRWVLLRHPTRWSNVPLDLARAATRERAQIITVLAATVGRDLMGYILQAL